MRSLAPLVLALGIVAAAACSDPAPRPVPAQPAATIPAPPAAPAPVPEPPKSFAAPPPAAIAASGDAGGLAAWTASRTAAFVQPLDAKGSPGGEPREVPLTSAHKLHAVYAVGAGFAIAAHDLCPDRKYFYKCLFLRAISARGEPVGGEVVATTREWIGEEVVARSGNVTAVLTSFMYVPPALFRLSLAEDGAVRVDRRDIEVDADVVAAVRLTATATGFAVLLRDEAEDSRRLIYAEIDAQGKLSVGPKRLAPGATSP